MSAAVPADDIRRDLALLHALDVRVATVGFRLASANTALCERKAPLLGLTLHDAQQYAGSVREIAVAHFRLGDGPSTMVVVEAGPVYLAGLRENDQLLSVNGTVFEAPSTTDGKSTYAGVERAEALLDQAVRAGTVELAYARDGIERSVPVTPVQGCDTRFEVMPSAKFNGAADGHYVRLTSSAVSFAADDDELAILLGHELAHNVLRHRDRLNAAGVPGGLLRELGFGSGKVRETERQADYVGIYLAARAGYDISKAPLFWERIAKSRGPQILAAPTHPRWSERVRLVRATVDEIVRKKALGLPIEPGKPPELTRD